MLNETTINKLNDMRLRSMADSLREQMKNPSFTTLSFEERIGLIVDAEWVRRKNNHLNKLIKKGTFKFPYACSGPGSDIAFIYLQLHSREA